jgi:transcriptional regulator with XRE-family HTH domain
VEPAEAFGHALRQRRHAASLTQEKLAFEAELERVFISHLENGKKKPSLETILKLAKGLKCKPGELVDDAAALLASAPKGRAPLAPPRVSRRAKPDPRM